jgi:hypothetical protein
VARARTIRPPTEAAIEADASMLNCRTVSICIVITLAIVMSIAPHEASAKGGTFHSPAMKHRGLMPRPKYSSVSRPWRFW